MKRVVVCSRGLHPHAGEDVARNWDRRGGRCTLRERVGTYRREDAVSWKQAGGSTRDDCEFIACLADLLIWELGRPPETPGGTAYSQSLSRHLDGVHRGHHRIIEKS